MSLHDLEVTRSRLEGVAISFSEAFCCLANAAEALFGVAGIASSDRTPVSALGGTREERPLDATVPVPEVVDSISS